MPLKIVRRGNTYTVTDGKKVYGKHSSKAKAERQVRAINANKHRKKK